MNKREVAMLVNTGVRKKKEREREEKLLVSISVTQTSVVGERL